MRLKFWKKVPSTKYPELCQFNNGTWGVRRKRDGGFRYAELNLAYEMYWWPPDDDYAHHFSGTLTQAHAALKRAFDFQTDKGSVVLLNGTRI